MSRLTALLLVVLAVALAGCAVPPQTRPEQVPALAVGPPATARPQPGPTRLAVYFVRGDRLHAVPRTAPRWTPERALALLRDGPTEPEATAGSASPLGSAELAVPPGSAEPGTVAVEAGDELVALAGRRQLLAVGQLVWTLTEVPGVERVLLLIDGRPVEVPTDSGSKGRAVTRADYASIAPA